MTDLALARQLLARDEAAFAEFFAAYFPRVYRFACSRLAGDEEAAEEVAQRTLIRAIDKLHTYRGEAALFTWMCTLCRREISTWLTRAGRRQELSLADDHPEVRAAFAAVAAFEDDPELAVWHRELAAFVHTTLDHLPGNYGDALEWRYIEGRSVTEIADRLGVGYKAAESVLSRARQAFRDACALTAPPTLAAFGLMPSSDAESA